MPNVAGAMGDRLFVHTGSLPSFLVSDPSEPCMPS
jgi:hypothetical protein